MTRTVLLAHAAATWAMTGIIWFVQIVHYPLFERVAAASFCGYESAHAARTTLVVAPLMLLELATALWLAGRSVVVPPDAAYGPEPSRVLAWVGLGLVAVIRLSTFALQVPQHQALRHGFDAGAHARLVRTNWIRTLAWSLRAALALWMLHTA